ncbi:hypothetical protein CCHL11_06592 [Colletotrichum chlorophyti]|uniref:Uncharacterized protein n=1 Tax=Colletotrichum chlorophyti TaxID=708187 RepID=A0A1Q8RXS3_9PEZI|nr:hypothetical protein CCHL11_06592 [Colletotrichum chlorophyti]
MSRNSSEQDGGALQSPIACESCRQRKRRLETRLAETEAALFRVVSGSLSGQAFESASSPALLPQAAWTPRQNKVDRVKEWESLPLQTPEDIQAWFRSKAAEHEDPVGDVPAASPQSLLSSVSEPIFVPPPPRDPGSVRSDHLAIADSVIEPQLRSMTPIIATPNPHRSSSDGVSKARELSKSQQDLYF